MTGLAGGFDSALGASSFSDLQDALAFLDAVSQRDHDVLIALERRKVEIEQQRVRLEALEVDLRGRQERLEATVADLVEKLEQQQALQARSEESAQDGGSAGGSPSSSPPPSPPAPTLAPPRAVVTALIRDGFASLGARTTDVALCVAERESNFESLAVNPATGAAGVFQFIPSTWTSLSRAGRPGRRFRVRRTGERRRRCLDGRALWLAPLEIGRGGLRSLTPEGAEHHSSEPLRASWTPRSVRPSSERGPTRYQVSIGPFPLTSIVPRRLQSNASFSSS